MVLRADARGKVTVAQGQRRRVAKVVKGDDSSSLPEWSKGQRTLPLQKREQ